MYQSHGKRALDLAVSLAAILVLSPVMALVALLIRREDSGPALFSQTRVGQCAREFTFFKFRSMPVGTPNLESARAGPLKTTRVGKAIRRTSLDELPQLFNVLAGDMSLVGPRPPLPAQEELIQLRRLNGSLKLRPGLTGLAQVNGHDGMANVEKAAWDARYCRDLSLLTDARIILRTVVYVTKRPPTY